MIWKVILSQHLDANTDNANTDNANTESTVIEDTSSDLDDLSELEGFNDLEELASEEPITSLNEEIYSFRNWRWW